MWQRLSCRPVTYPTAMSPGSWNLSLMSSTSEGDPSEIRNLKEKTVVRTIATFWKFVFSTPILYGVMLYDSCYGESNQLEREKKRLKNLRFPYLPRLLVVWYWSRFNTGNSGKTAYSRGVAGHRHGLRYRSQVKNVHDTNASYLPRILYKLRTKDALNEIKKNFGCVENIWSKKKSYKF